MFSAKLQPTISGRALLAKAQQGAEMKFTSVHIGSGYLVSLDPTEVADVIYLVKECPITSITRNGSRTDITFTFVQDNSTAYYFRELALMAQDPDLGEIAYLYANDGSNAELIPVPEGTVLEREITITVVLSNVETVKAVISSAAYAGKEEFSRHVNDNTRHVTAEDRKAWNEKVGLGQDGKIPAQYLPAQKTQSLNDLDGTLNVQKGGTGKSSWSEHRILYASGVESLGQLAFPPANKSILRQNTSGAPYWSSMEELGAELGTAKIASGSYTGALTSGNSTDQVGCFTSIDALKSKGRKIMLPFAPKMLYVFADKGIIYSSESGTASRSIPPYIIMEKMGVYHKPYNQNAWVAESFVAYMEGKNLYVGNAAARLASGEYYVEDGLNKENTTYNWIAIA